MDISLTLTSEEFQNELRAIKDKRNSHAYLVEGEKGIGKHSFALALALALFCNKDVPCGICPQCKKVLSGNHPDVHFFQPEKDLIKVDVIRQLISGVYDTPYEGNVKVYIIDGFDKANEQAQNALLKTLEEPPENVIFFLLCENSLALLPTVRSRCKSIRLKGFSQEKILERLKRENLENAEYASSASHGNVGTALKLANNEDFLFADRLASEVADGLDKTLTVFEVEEKIDLDGEFLSLLEKKLLDEFEKFPDKKRLMRISAVQEANEAKKKNVNKTLIKQKLAYLLVKGGNKWQK